MGRGPHATVRTLNVGRAVSLGGDRLDEAVEGLVVDGKLEPRDGVGELERHPREHVRAHAQDGHASGLAQSPHDRRPVALLTRLEGPELQEDHVQVGVGTPGRGACKGPVVEDPVTHLRIGPVAREVGALVGAEIEQLVSRGILGWPEGKLQEAAHAHATRAEAADDGRRPVDAPLGAPTDDGSPVAQAQACFAAKLLQVPLGLIGPAKSWQVPH